MAVRMSIWHCSICGDLIFLIEGGGRVCLQGCMNSG